MYDTLIKETKGASAHHYPLGLLWVEELVLRSRYALSGTCMGICPDRPLLCPEKGRPINPMSSGGMRSWDTTGAMNRSPPPARASTRAWPRGVDDPADNAARTAADCSRWRGLMGDKGAAGRQSRPSPNLSPPIPAPGCCITFSTPLSSSPSCDEWNECWDRLCPSTPLAPSLPLPLQPPVEPIP